MKPPVAHLVPALFDRKDGVLGGAERYAFELARHMAAVVPTRLISFGGERRLIQEGPLEITVLGPSRAVRGQVGNPMAPGLFRELSKAGVVHCHQQHILSSSLAAMFCRLTGRRVVVSDLGGGGWDISGYISTDSWYHRHLHISAYSRFISGHGERKNAHIIYGGVDTEKFCPAETVRRRDTVLFVGRLVPHKGVHVLIEALPADMKLVIAGRPYDPDYHSMLRRMAQGRQVIFKPDCTDSELVDLYRTSLCLVLPSVYKLPDGSETKVPELLGQTLLEAMACGCPVVSSSVASLPEVVTDGKTGFVVPPGEPAPLAEKLSWLGRNPAEADRMGRQGRGDVLARFSWPAVVDRCLSHYQH